MYSQKIMEKLLQNSTRGEGKEGDVRVVKLKEGTTALVARTLSPEVDDNSAIMVVMEVRGGCVLGTAFVRKHSQHVSVGAFPILSSLPQGECVLKLKISGKILHMFSAISLSFCLLYFLSPCPSTSYLSP